MPTCGHDPQHFVLYPTQSSYTCKECARQRARFRYKALYTLDWSQIKEAVQCQSQRAQAHLPPASS